MKREARVSVIFVFLSFLFLSLLGPLVVLGYDGAIAYYKFENNLNAEVGCPSINPSAGTGSGITYQSSVSGFGQAVYFDSSSKYLTFGNWQINSIKNAMSVNIRVKVSSLSDETYICGKNNVWRFEIRRTSCYSMGCTRYYYPSFTVRVNGNTRRAATSSFTLSTDTWYHFVGTYDGQNIRLYVNGELRDTEGAPGTWDDGDDNVFIGGTRMVLDEFRVYNYALSSSQISSLNSASGPAQIPSIDGSAISDIQVTGLQTVPLNPTVSTPHSISTWTQLTGGGCDSLTYNPDANTLQVAISGFPTVGTYTFEIFVSNGHLCDSEIAKITVDGSSPEIENSDKNITQLNVTVGGTVFVEITIKGYPEPNYQWQELIYVPPVAGDGRRYIVSRTNVDVLKLEKRLSGNEELLNIDTRHSERADGNWSAPVSDKPPCDSDNNITSDCNTWRDIEGANKNFFTTPAATYQMNGAVIHLVASNYKGSVVTNPITILVVEPISTGSGGGDGDGDGSEDLTGVIVGPIIGGVVLCCLIMCIIACIIAAILIRSKRSDDGFPGIPPDYDEVIFGEFNDDDLFVIKRKNTDALDKLERLLMKDDYGLALTIASQCHSKDDENVSRTLAYVAHHHGKGVPMIQNFLSIELDAVKESMEGTLFRSNTMTPKLFKHYAVLLATTWLWQRLAAYIWSINEAAKELDDLDDEEMGSSSGSKSSVMRAIGRNKSSKRTGGGTTNFEIDPLKMDDASDPKVNTLELWLTAQKIFSTVSRSYSYIPRELCDILRYCYEEVQQRFNNERYKAVGGFFFLRFVCPALLAPHLYGLMSEPPSPTAQRQLILVGKVLQNLSNDTLPGAKEDYMARLNDFIASNQDELRNFYDNILNSNSQRPSNRNIPSHVKQNSLAYLFNILKSEQESIKDELAMYYEAQDPIWGELEDILKSSAPIQKTQQ